MKAGDMAVCDCGAESSMGYASDTTRTIPVSGRFTADKRKYTRSFWECRRMHWPP